MRIWELFSAAVSQGNDLSYASFFLYLTADMTRFDRFNLVNRLPRTLFSLFWSMFGLISVDAVEIKYENKDKGLHAGGSNATSLVERVGMLLFALYHVAIIIVLINMLIAMMSHSFEDIQVRTDC